jgi:hypothetical protein
MASNTIQVPRQTGFRRVVSLRWLLLVLVALQGPIPWCHSHGNLANSPGAFSWLGDHLRTHHAAVFPQVNPFFGWHLHAELPTSSNHNSKQPSNPDQDLPPTTNPTDGLSVLLADNAHNSQPAISVEDLSHHGTMPLLVSSQNTAHFFDSFAPTLSLPMRFCVLRS